MSARVLVVDDILPNVKLLEVKLKREYFDVVTATSGAEALQKVGEEAPDIVLLDVMMPEMDGFEVCKRLKSDPKTAHIPVVMVTALTDTSDRVKGLEAGADDFLSKPVNDTALFSRVRSLVRLKMTIDEWRARENTASQLGMGEEAKVTEVPFDRANILLVNDVAFESEKIVETLQKDSHKITHVKTGHEAIDSLKTNVFDMIMVSLNLEGEDGLRLCSYFKSNEATRATPIVMISEDKDIERIAQGLEMGAHDYVVRPVDRNEVIARTRSQIRRKRYQDQLRSNYEQNLNLAVKDTLTGLFNRRYLMTHFEKQLILSRETGKDLCVLLFDLDNFKSVNDTYGHHVGDEVLITFADRISDRVRSLDVFARQGGEEFVLVMPDITQELAIQISDRLRAAVESEPFKVSTDEGYLSVTTSIGGAIVKAGSESAEEALKRADDALYNAKETGRNLVVFDRIGVISNGDVADSSEAASN